MFLPGRPSISEKMLYTPSSRGARRDCSACYRQIVKLNSIHQFTTSLLHAMTWRDCAAM